MSYEGASDLRHCTFMYCILVVLCLVRGIWRGGTQIAVTATILKTLSDAALENIKFYQSRGWTVE
jgi:hypothetical protein